MMTFGFSEALLDQQLTVNMKARPGRPEWLRSETWGYFTLLRAYILFHKQRLHSKAITEISFVRLRYQLQ